MSRPIERWKYLVLVCHGSDCRRHGAKAVRTQAKDTIRSLGLKKECMLVSSRCTGNCKQGPIACIQPNNRWLEKATPESMDKAIREELAKPSKK